LVPFFFFFVYAGFRFGCILFDSFPFSAVQGGGVGVLRALFFDLLPSASFSGVLTEMHDELLSMYPPPFFFDPKTGYCILAMDSNLRPGVGFRLT